MSLYASVSHKKGTQTNVEEAKTVDFEENILS